MLKRYFYLILILTLLPGLIRTASIKVEYKTSLAPEIIKTTQIRGEEYFNVFQLNKAFKAIIKEDLIDQRLNINIYNSQIIILLDSSYLIFNNELYNFGIPTIKREGKNYLPKSFIMKVIPILFPKNIELTDEGIRASTPIDNSIKTIVIDPGHGGRDPGAVGYSRKNYEKDIVLKVSSRLKQLLESKLDLQVILTRDKDKFVSLQERTQMANRENADLFVSIHCNANLSNKVHGIEVYYLSNAKTDEDRAVEALENSVVYDFEGGEDAVKRYDDLAFILADMAQNEHLLESYELSSILCTHTSKSVNFKNNGVRQANFYVLRGAFMPSVLVELGYLSNKEEEKKLIKRSYQEKLAEALFTGIKNFKYKYDQMQ